MAVFPKSQEEKKWGKKEREKNHGNEVCRGLFTMAVTLNSYHVNWWGLNLCLDQNSFVFCGFGVFLARGDFNKCNIVLKG